MKTIATALLVIGTLVATTGLSEARNYHHHPVIHRHHGPAVFLRHHPHHYVHHAKSKWHRAHH